MGLGRITYDVCRSHVRRKGALQWLPGHKHYDDKRTITTVPCPIGTAILSAGALGVLRDAIQNNAITQLCEALTTPAYDFLHDGALGTLSWVHAIPFNFLLSKWAPVLRGKAGAAGNVEEEGVRHPAQRLNLGFIAFPRAWKPARNPMWQPTEVRPNEAKRLSVLELEAVFSTATAIHIGQGLRAVAPVNATLHRIHTWAERHPWNDAVLDRVATLRASGMLEDPNDSYQSTPHYKRTPQHDTHGQQLYNVSYASLCQ